MGIDKLFSSLQEETDRMADAVDKVFDDTDRALKDVDVSNLTKEQEDALEHQIEKEVADSIQEAEQSKETLLDKQKGKGKAQIISMMGNGLAQDIIIFSAI